MIPPELVLFFGAMVLLCLIVIAERLDKIANHLKKIADKD